MNVFTSRSEYILTHKLTFRFAREDDLPKLEWFGEYIHFRRNFEDTFREQQAGRRLMLLADIDDFPIGQIFIAIRESQNLLNRDNRRSYLYAFRVMSQYRGQGIGTKLIQEAERLLIERRRQYVRLSVAKNNLDAKRLYMRQGYYMIGENNGSWSYTDHLGNIVEVYEPCWVLEKRLVDPHRKVLFGRS